jgi:hypothetical protein
LLLLLRDELVDVTETLLFKGGVELPLPLSIPPIRERLLLE